MPDEFDDEYERRLEQKLRQLKQEADTTSELELGPLERKLEQTRANLEEVQELRKSDEALFDSEFEQRLSDFHQKVDQAKTIRETKVNQEVKNQARERDTARGLGLGLSVAYTIIGLPLAGALLGWLLDRATGGHTYVGIGVVVFGALGMVVALLILNKQNK